MDNLDAILEGEEINLIDKNSEVGSLLKAVNSYARKWIYSDESAEKIELAGRSALDGLLTRFSPLLDLNADQFDGLLKNDSDRIKGLDFEIRLLRRLPQTYKDKYEIADRGEEKTRRAQLIVDFLAGMTDDFCLDMYQVLEGIKVK